MPAPDPGRIDQLLESFNHRARIAQTFGMTLRFDEAGRAIIEMPYKRELDHALGGIHGGVMMTLLDSAGWFAVAAQHDCGCWVATSDLTVHLLRPSTGVPLKVVGEVIRTGKRQGVAEARIYEPDGKLAAHGVGTYVVLPDLPLG